MASAKVRARYNLARDVRDSQNILKRSSDAAVAQNEKAADASFWGRMVGAGAGVVAGLALAPFTAGTSLAISSLGAATIGAGLGSYAGSSVGEAYAGGIDQDVASGGFQVDKVSELNKELASYAKGVEQDRIMNAASDAFSVYMAGGGSLKPGNIGAGTGSFKIEAMDLTKLGLDASSSALDIYKAKLMGQGGQLIKGIGEQYASKKGLGIAYQEYLKR